MTPERAEKLGARWWWAGVAALVVGAVLDWLGIPNTALVGFAVAMICLSARSGHFGWANGYRAARREELDRRAGVPGE